MRYSTLIVILLFLSVSSSFSQIEFGKHVEISQSTTGYLELKHFDFDNDGYDDLLCSSTKNDRVVWYRNLGNGQFGNQNLIYTALNHYTESAHAGDFNNDGLLDIVFCSENYNEVRWAENLGGGQFANTEEIPSFLDDPITVFTGDINGDGNIDVLAADRGANKIVWFESFGNGTFAPSQHVITSNANGAEDVFAADLDNDGDLDVLSASQSDDKVAWYENLGGGVFGPQQILSINGDYPKSVVAADMNNDGDIDVIASSINDNKIVWFENLGGGVFSSEIVISTVAFEAYDLNISDINNDGQLDILAAFHIGNQTVWYQNLGSGVFSAEQVISSFSHGATTAIAFDANNNGNLDVFTGSRFSGQIEKNENLGGGVFGLTELVSVSASDPIHVETVDIDNDGDQDVVCQRSGNTYSAGAYAGTIWYENLGNGEFDKQRTVIIDTALSMRFDDLDGDNFRDLITIAYGSGKLRWYKNLGGGNFSTEYLISNAVSGGKDIFSIDLDQDGDIDVISASSNNNKIAWYENLGSGIFGPEQVVSLVANGAFFVYSTDFDNDGDLDILSASNFDNEFVWYENNGSQQFGVEQVLSTTVGQEQRLVDLDYDGDLDFVFVYGSNIVYCENLGNLTYANLVTFTPSFSGTIKDYKLVDVDFDNDLDLFVAAPALTTVWLENTGNFTFATPQLLSDTMGFPNGIYLSDLDNDGDLDPISISGGDDVVAWSKNKLYSNTYVTGKLFLDVNNNQVQDSNETGAFNISVFSTPQSDVTNTFYNGEYVMNFSDVPGSYQLQPQSLTNWSISTDSLLYNVTIDSTFSTIDSLDFGFKPDTILTSLVTDITGSFPVCNTTINYWLTVNNSGTTAPSGVFHLKLDDSITYVNSIFTPDSIVGQNLYWSYDSLNYFSSEQMNLQVLTPDFNSIGDTLRDTLNLYAFDSLGVLQLSATDVLSQVLVCAYDPNDKTASPLGLDSMGYIAPMPNEIEYTIRFQNTGNDTANVVLITDQLDTNLIWNSLNPIAASHSYQTSMDQNGVVTFTFDNIMLPDSNVNEIASHGFITYRINVTPNLAVGTSIRNFANIYFDQNLAIVTNTKIHTLYDCSQIDYSISSTTCQNESVLGNVQDVVSSFVTVWDIPGIYTSTGDNFNWLASVSGNFDVSITMSNGICTKDTLVPISILPSEQTILNDVTVCEGDSLLVFGNYVSSTGLYVDFLQTLAGCDSNVFIDIIVVPIPVVSLSNFILDTVCINSGLQTLPIGTPSNGTYSISGLTGNSFDPSSAGLGEHVLYYTFENSDNCVGSDSVTIFVDQCAGIDNLSNPYGITIHPNPFSNFTEITFENEEIGEYRLVVSNALGEIVLERSKLNSSSVILDRNNLLQGVYFLTIIKNEMGIIGTFKVVIN